MTQETLKVELREILTEFGATSPTRDWSPNRNLEEIQQEVIEHREAYLHELLDTIKQRLPKEKDMSKEHSHDLVYRPSPRDGDKIPETTYINYDERRGYNACLKEIRKLLK